MAINILVGTVQGILFTWEDLKLLGKVMKRNKVKSAAIIFAPFPIAIVAGTLIVREYRVSLRERGRSIDKEGKEIGEMEPV